MTDAKNLIPLDFDSAHEHVPSRGRGLPERDQCPPDSDSPSATPTKRRAEYGCLEALVNASQDAVLIIDSQRMRVTTFNSKAAHMLKYAFDELSDISVDSLVGADSIWLATLADTTLEQHESRSAPLKLIGADGSLIRIQAVASVFQIDTQKFLLMTVRSLSTNSVADNLRRGQPAGRADQVTQPSDVRGEP